MAWTEWQTATGDGLDFTHITYRKKFHAELRGGVARIAVNRQEKYNAFTDFTMKEMFRAFYEANHDPMIGVLVLTGEGDHFGTGGDVEWEHWGIKEQFLFGQPVNHLTRISRKPVIAAIKGFCIGGSNHLAYLCDMSIAADNSIFGQNGPRVSSPADGYVVGYLPRVVGAKKAREIWMTCRRYSASEALELGLINSVVPLDYLDDEVDRHAESILRGSPACIEILKASFDWEMDTMPNAHGIFVGALYHDFFDSVEGKEGGAAFLERRKPDFWKIRQAEVDSQKAGLEL